MFIYLAVPVLIIVGLCIFFYMAGRYVRIGKKQEEVKAPDRAPALEKEIEKLKIALESKNRELEERNKAVESIAQENQALLARTRQDNTYKIEEPKEDPEDADKLSVSPSQPETEPAADNIAALPISHSYEDVPKEPEEKSEDKKPKEKKKHKKAEKKIKHKPSRKKK